MKMDAIELWADLKEYDGVEEKVNRIEELLEEEEINVQVLTYIVVANSEGKSLGLFSTNEELNEAVMQMDI